MIRHNGKEWIFDTVDEALAFERGRKVIPDVKPGPRVKVIKVGRTPKRVRRQASLDRLSEGSRRLLKAASLLPAGGALSEQFAHLAGLSSSKALPPLMMMLGKELRHFGMTTDDVIARERVYVKGKGKSNFRSGKRLSEVLHANQSLFAGA